MPKNLWPISLSYVTRDTEIVLKNASHSLSLRGGETTMNTMDHSTAPMVKSRLRKIQTNVHGTAHCDDTGLTSGILGIKNRDTGPHK